MSSYEASGPVKHAPIAIAASAQLLALVAGKKIRVIAYAFNSVGAGTVTFLSGGSGGTALTGAMPVAANGRCESSECVAGHFDTVLSENLYVTLGSSATAQGHITYQEIV
jgi:hypothetical protein